MLVAARVSDKAPGVPTRSDAVFDPGVAAVAQFQVGQLAAGPAGGGGDHVGPGPGWVDLEDAVAGGAHDPPGHGQDA